MADASGTFRFGRRAVRVSIASLDQLARGAFEDVIAERRLSR
jgi:hypothetical protein